MFSITIKSLYLLPFLIAIGFALTYPIIGTNQVKFYQNDGILTTTPSSSSDPFYGQDAQYSHLTPSYKDNGDGTITDLNTQLMWQSKRGNKMTIYEAQGNATTFNLAGYTDWRFASIKELYSLIEFTGKSGETDAQCIPYINTNYFEIIFGDVTGERVIDGQDFSSTLYVSTVMQGQSADFGVNFIDGRIKGYGFSVQNLSSKYTRYVRGPSNYGVNDFVDNGDSTITDRATGLMWAQKDSGSGMNWKDALAWVQTKNNENYLGHSDWRMPSAKELQSIVDYTRSPDKTNSAAIDPLFSCTQITNEGGATDYPWYWTGTTHLEGSDTTSGSFAVYITFGRALGYMQFGTNTYYTLVDVHGAGAQRSDPKSGSPSDYPLGKDSSGKTVYGHGPQGDVIRINNYVRLVRTTQTTSNYSNIFKYCEFLFAIMMILA